MSLLDKARELGYRTDERPNDRYNPNVTYGIAVPNDRRFLLIEDVMAIWPNIHTHTLGSYQSNHGDRLTYDRRAIAHGLAQELGIYWLAQLTASQSWAVFSFFLADTQRRFGNMVKGSTPPAIYNLDKRHVERGKPCPPVPVAIGFSRDDVFAFSFGTIDSQYGISPGGGIARRYADGRIEVI